MHESAKLWLGKETFDTYLVQPRATRITSSDRLLAGVLELQHIAQITAVDEVIREKLSNPDKNLFKELDAYWVFFGLFACHLRNINPNIETKL